jgi:hypothetical protein
MIVSKRESEVIKASNARMPTRTVVFRNTPWKSKKGPKVVTKCHTTQRGATQSKVLPNKAPLEQVEIETRPARAIRE